VQFQISGAVLLFLLYENPCLSTEHKKPSQTTWFLLFIAKNADQLFFLHTILYLMIFIAKNSFIWYNMIDINGT
jgi:hypothetical protein